MNVAKAKTSVFGKYIQQISDYNTVFWFTKKAYTLTAVNELSVQLNPDLLNAFHLKQGDRLLVVKSAAIAMTFTPVEIWKEKLAKRGLVEAIENMSRLEVF